MRTLNWSLLGKMRIEEMKAGIEALLFSFGEPVGLAKIAGILGVDQETTRKIIDQLMDDYQVAERGIEIIRLEDNYQLCSKKQQYNLLKKAVHKVKTFELTDVLVETLSIIAYKQPLTKVHIEKVRGVKSDHAVNKLVEYQLVEEKGRMEAPGRPILFGTTDVFLRHFGLKSVEDLPQLEEETLEAIAEEVEQEMQISLEEQLT